MPAAALDAHHIMIGHFLRTLATQQPAAGDLRVIVATTHIAGELERIGDHASSVADVGERIADEAPIDSLHKIQSQLHYRSARWSELLGLQSPAERPWAALEIK